MATITRALAAATTSFILKRPSSSFQIAKRSSNHLSLTFNRTLSKRFFTCRAIYRPEEVHAKEEGQVETLDYRVFFVDNSGKKVSPWHDIPLHLGDGVFNFVVEIPKESSAKMEVATDELFTPIKQDTKKGKLRYYPPGRGGSTLTVTGSMDPVDSDEAEIYMVFA